MSESCGVMSSSEDRLGGQSSPLAQSARLVCSTAAAASAGPSNEPVCIDKTLPEVINVPQKKRIVKVFDINAFKEKGLHSLVADRLKTLKNEQEAKKQKRLNKKKPKKESKPKAMPKPKAKKSTSDELPTPPPQQGAKLPTSPSAEKLTSDSKSLQMVKRIMNEKLKKKLSTSPAASQPTTPVASATSSPKFNFKEGKLNKSDDLNLKVFHGFTSLEVERESKRRRRISECIESEKQKIPSYTTLRSYLNEVRSGDNSISHNSSYDIEMEEYPEHLGNVDDGEHTILLNIINRDVDENKIEIEVIDSKLDFNIAPADNGIPKKLDIKVNSCTSRDTELLYPAVGDIVPMSDDNFGYPIVAVPEIIDSEEIIIEESCNNDFILATDGLINTIPQSDSNIIVEDKSSSGLEDEIIPNIEQETQNDEHSKTNAQNPVEEEDAVDFLMNCFFPGEADVNKPTSVENDIIDETFAMSDDDYYDNDSNDGIAAPIDSPNKLIVLENKVLSDREKVDLNSLIVITNPGESELLPKLIPSIIGSTVRSESTETPFEGNFVMEEEQIMEENLETISISDSNIECTTESISSNTQCSTLEERTKTVASTIKEHLLNIAKELTVNSEIEPNSSEIKPKENENLNSKTNKAKSKGMRIKAKPIINRNVPNRTKRNVVMEEKVKLEDIALGEEENSKTEDIVLDEEEKVQPEDVVSDVVGIESENTLETDLGHETLHLSDNIITEETVEPEVVCSPDDIVSSVDSIESENTLGTGLELKSLYLFEDTPIVESIHEENETIEYDNTQVVVNESKIMNETYLLSDSIEQKQNVDILPSIETDSFEQNQADEDTKELRSEPESTNLSKLSAQTEPKRKEETILQTETNNKPTKSSERRFVKGKINLVQRNQNSRGTRGGRKAEVKILNDDISKDNDSGSNELSLETHVNTELVRNEDGDSKEKDVNEIKDRSNELEMGISKDSTFKLNENSKAELITDKPAEIECIPTSININLDSNIETELENNLPNLNKIEGTPTKRDYIEEELQKLNDETETHYNSKPAYELDQLISVTESKVDEILGSILEKEQTESTDDSEIIKEVKTVESLNDFSNVNATNSISASEIKDSRDELLDILKPDISKIINSSITNRSNRIKINKMKLSVSDEPIIALKASMMDESDPDLKENVASSMCHNEEIVTILPIEAKNIDGTTLSNNIEALEVENIDESTLSLALEISKNNSSPAKASSSGVIDKSIVFENAEISPHHIEDVTAVESKLLGHIDSVEDSITNNDLVCNEINIINEKELRRPSEDVFEGFQEDSNDLTTNDSNKKPSTPKAKIAKKPIPKSQKRINEFFGLSKVDSSKKDKESISEVVEEIDIANNSKDRRKRGTDEQHLKKDKETESSKTSSRKSTKLADNKISKESDKEIRNSTRGSKSSKSTDAAKTNETKSSNKSIVQSSSRRSTSKSKLDFELNVEKSSKKSDKKKKLSTEKDVSVDLKGSTKQSFSKPSTSKSKLDSDSELNVVSSNRRSTSKSKLDFELNVEKSSKKCDNKTKLSTEKDESVDLKGSTKQSFSKPSTIKSKLDSDSELNVVKCSKKSDKKTKSSTEKDELSISVESSNESTRQSSSKRSTSKSKLDSDTQLNVSNNSKKSNKKAKLSTEKDETTISIDLKSSNESSNSKLDSGLNVKNSKKTKLAKDETLISEDLKSSVEQSSSKEVTNKSKLDNELNVANILKKSAKKTKLSNKKEEISISNEPKNSNKLEKDRRSIKISDSGDSMISGKSEKPKGSKGASQIETESQSRAVRKRKAVAEVDSTESVQNRPKRRRNDLKTEEVEAPKILSQPTESENEEKIPLKKRFSRKRARLLNSDAESKVEVPTETPVAPQKVLKQSCISFESPQTPKLIVKLEIPSSGVKRRGRPPIASENFADNNYIHPRLLLVSNRADLEITPPADDGRKTLDDEVRCGLCREIVKTNKWKGHLPQHYGIGWKEGQTPLDMESRTTVLQALIGVFKKQNTKSMSCRLCKKSMKSGLGLLYHIELCGLTEKEKHQTRLNCEHCGNEYARLSMPIHLKSCPVLWEKNFQNKMTQQSEVEQQSEIVDANQQLSNSGRVKRMSTIRAENKFKEDTEIEFNPNEFLRCASIPFGGTVIKWRNQIRHTGRAACISSDCTFRCESLEAMKTHCEGCKIVAEAGFVCIKCKFTNQDAQVVRDHISATHDPNSEDFVASESEAEVGSESSDSEGSSGVNENDDGGGDSDGNTYGNVWKVHSSHGSLANDVDAKYKKLIVWSRESRISEMTTRWMMQFLSCHYSSQPKFPSAIPNFIISQNRPEDYIPKNTISMKFSYSEDKSFNKLVGKTQPAKDWMEIEQFNHIDINGDHLIFIGGPIKSLAWAPIDVNSKSQYLAVTYRKEYNRFTRQLNPKVAKTLILIYKVDPDSLKATIMYGITIENGPIHTMDFLPSGGYVPEMNRLGLLAVGGVDTDIKVYSLPLKVMLNCDDNGKWKFPLLNLKPSSVLTLNVREDDENATNYQSQCTKLVWSKGKNHNIICAGFGNGCIGIWDITDDDENINRFVDKETNKYTPVSYLSVSEKKIIGIDLHYDTNGPRWICIACGNRLFKIYDLGNISHPVLISSDIAAGMMMATDWPVVWENPNFSLSDYFLAKTTSLVTVSPMGLLFKSRRSARSLGGINDMSFNEWMNVTAFGTENGDISVCMFREMNLAVDSKGVYDCKMMSVTDITRLDGKDIPKRYGKKFQDPDDFEMFETDYREKYGLVFGQLNFYQKAKNSYVVEHDRFPPINLCHFIRINQIQFNRNRNAHKLIAVGYENGFIRIMQFNIKSYFKNRCPN